MVFAYSSSILILFVSIWLGVSIGSADIPLSTLWDNETNPSAYSILWGIRMPRVILAGLVGSSLAIAGQPSRIT